MISEQHVIEAVAIDRATTSRGLLQRLFALWFDSFVYNQIWEDPRVDLKALEIGSDSRLLTISSGGCNVLNYLIENPESITAVDLNRYHIYLLRLKLAAVKKLPSHDDFFRFFGFGKHIENRDKYEQYIRPHLDSDTAEFWDRNSIFGRIWHGSRINYFVNGGLYDRSRNGYFLRFFHRFARIRGLRPDAVLNATSIDEQKDLYGRNIEPFFNSTFIRLLERLPITTFGLGIPPQQLSELRNDLAADATLVDTYRKRVKRLACSFPIDDNYFAWQAFSRHYDIDKRKAVPEYLKSEHFACLKQNAHHVRTVVGSVTYQIRQNPHGTFNRFVLLDAQDWMDRSTLIELWQQIAEKSEPGSRVVFRTASATSPLERNLPSELLKKFRYEIEFSRKLFEQDRVSIYGGFHLYILR